MQGFPETRLHECIMRSCWNTGRELWGLPRRK